MSVNGKVLPDLTQMDRAGLEALISQMSGKLARVQSRKLTLKVSKAGAVSVYGMGRWPVTLYRGQWEKLLEAKDDILSFISDNSADLSEKE